MSGPGPQRASSPSLIPRVVGFIERFILHTVHTVLSISPAGLWAYLCVTQCCTMGYVNPPVRQITSWQELNQSLHDRTCVLEIAHARAHTLQLTHPHISAVRSFHIFEISHTCVIMLCSHITLKTPTKPQLSMQYTTTTYTFFLQPLPVPSSLSVNNPLCPIYQTLTTVLETCMCWKKDVRGSRGWVLVCDRASFPRDQGTAAHTHTRCVHCVWNWECLLFTKEQDCFMCVWLSLFQPAWNSRSHSESLCNASRGGLGVWTRHSNFSVGALDCLSMFVFVCTHDDSALSVHLSGHNRCILHQDGKEKRRYNYL